MRNFDVFVIGTGTAGETAAGLLVQAGLSVGIADSDRFGGTCALRGCQPKKYLVVPAHAALEGAALTARGFVAPPELDWSVMQRSRAEFTDAVPASTEEGLRNRGITVFHGQCRFIDADTISCEGETITARRFLLAAGARPRELPLPGGELAVSSDDFLSLPELPRHVTFVGGGYISMEFATVAAAAGAGVTVLQRGDLILDRFDPDLVDQLQRSCLVRGMDIRTGVTPEKITAEAGSGNGFTVHLEDGSRINTDLVVAAIGRVANTDTLDLERAGLESSPRGIETDREMRTAVPTILAVGDCVAGIQLSPVSDKEAQVAARNIIADLQGGTTRELEMPVLPTVVFTWPQLAQFGLSVEEARQRGGVRINSGSGAGWPSYRRLNEKHMRYTVIIDENTDTILGAHLLAPQAGEMINLLALAAKAGTTTREFREFPWAYPTYLSDLKYMLG